MAEQEKRFFRITNTGPGPRQVLTPTGGKTIPRGGNVVMELTESDLRPLKPYSDLKQLSIEPASAEDMPKPTGGDIGGEAPKPSGNPVELRSVGDIVPEEPVVIDEEGEAADTDSPVDAEDEVGDDKPTHVEHRGFGRWYGFSGDEKLTEAMTESEADAYAEEHNLQKPVAANPSDEEGPAEEPAPSTDETETPAEEPAEEQQP